MERQFRPYSNVPGQLHDATGSYSTSFLLGMGALVATVLVSLRIRERRGGTADSVLAAAEQSA